MLSWSAACSYFALLEQFEDAPVAGDVRLVELLRGRDDVEEQAELGQQPAGDVVEPGAVGEADEVAVEAHVRSTDRGPATGQRGGLGGLDVVLHRLEPARGQLGIAVDETADHIDLEDAAEPVEVDHIVLVQLGHEDAAVQLVDQQAFVGEQPEGLAQRVPADLEDLGELDLGQLGAGLERSLGDAAA